ncbi:hypothetical protein ACD591_08530 [Rufibacter glacialis]|uniref:DUF892 family protein n=1 Tax=Rufibacter glacialis TaxID=1259555 RepID=A0ABV4RDZ0_9BACT|nr:hypothetical protein [Rufibacter glacialis]GGK79329.1 hypothetical protein GCM10011405_29000 [Rufibacter glacialis]
MAGNISPEKSLEGVLTQEQDSLLDLYLNNLDNFFENQKNAEKIQVEIETLHLKKILTE